MNKGIVFIGIILAFLLASCASNFPAAFKPFEGSSKIFKVNAKGTVEVKSNSLKDQRMHWVFVRCAHWSGCYMRCQGPIKTCRSIAKKSDLKITHTLTRKTNK